MAEISRSNPGIQPPADMHYQLELLPVGLTSSELRELGKSQSSRAGVWEALKFVGLGFVATRHFTNKAVMHIRTKNMDYITREFGLSQPSAKALAKTAMVKRTIVTDTHKKFIERDAHKLQVLEAVRDPNHWARDMFSVEDQKTFDSLSPEKALKPDGMVVARHLITQWNELNRLSEQVPPLIFKELLAAAGAFESNVRPELTAKLNELVSVYNALPVDTEDRVATAIAVNTIINEASKRQGYAGIGEADSFRDFVTEKISTSEGLREVYNPENPPEQPIEHAFNRDSFAVFNQGMVDVVGGELTNVISRAVLNEDVVSGASHYKRSDGYEGIKGTLEPIVGMKNQCDAYGIGDTFHALLSGGLRNIASVDSAQKLSALGEQLARHSEMLSQLGEVKASYEREGLGDRYNELIGVRVREFSDQVSTTLNSIVGQMQASLRTAVLDKDIASYRTLYGDRFANTAQESLQGAMAGSAVSHRETVAYQSVQRAIQALDGMHARVVSDDGLTGEEFKSALNDFMSTQRGAFSYLANGEIPVELEQACNRKMTEKAVVAWAEANGGTAFVPYLNNLIATDRQFADVKSGKMTLQQFFGGLSSNAQRRLVVLSVSNVNPNVSEDDVFHALFNSDKPIEYRIRVVQAMNTHIARLAKVEGQTPERVLQFVRDMADPYLVEANPGHVETLFKYAIDLAGKRADGATEPLFSVSIVTKAMREQVDAIRLQGSLSPKDAVDRAESTSVLGGSLSASVFGVNRFSPEEKALFARCVQHKAYEYIQAEFQKNGGVFGANEARFAREIASQFKPMDELPTHPLTMQYVQQLCEGAVRLNRECGLTASDVRGLVPNPLESRDSLITFSPQAVQSRLTRDVAAAQEALTDFIEVQAQSAAPLKEATLGGVLNNAFSNIGGAATTALREVVFAQAPEPDPTLLGHFNRHLGDLAGAINASPYGTFDGIMENVVTNRDTRTAVTAGLTLARGVAGALPIVPRRQATGGSSEIGLSKILETQFGLAYQEVRQIPPNSTLIDAGVMLSDPDKGMVSQLVGTMIGGVGQARIDKREQTTPDKMAPFSAVFLHVLPQLRENEKLIKMALGFSTNWLGRKIVKSALPKLLTKFADDLKLEPAQREIVIKAVPVILDIIEMLKLDSDGATEQFSAVMTILNTVSAAINSENEPDAHVLGESLVAALQGEQEALMKGGDVLIAIGKAIHFMGSAAAPASSS